MKERPILFSSDMVRAILAGRKTQTRRILMPRHTKRLGDCTDEHELNGWNVCLADPDVMDENDMMAKCPHGYEGDRLWVRETWAAHWMYDNVKPSEIPDDGESLIYYPANGGFNHEGIMGRGHFLKNRPSIFMPRWASRITLEIKSIRVEELNKINRQDAAAEGVEIFNEDGNLWYSGWFEGAQSWFDDPWKWHCDDPIQAFKELWDSINFKRGFGFATNPWVWVIEFEKIKAS